MAELEARFLPFCPQNLRLNPFPLVVNALTSKPGAFPSDAKAFSNPPTQAQVQAVLSKLNEHILASHH
jgi:hypothetical protein